MIKVAVLDSGIDITHKKFSNVNISPTIKTNNSFSNDILSDHGTCVADVLRKSIKKNGSLNDLEVFDIQVFEDLNNINDKNIIDAFKYCIEHNIDIINISIGFPSDSPNKSLYTVCYEAYQKGIIIISAAYYKDIPCYPASFPFAFGVTGGIISSLDEFGVQENNDIELIGKGSLQRAATLSGKSRFVAGTSFATAHISGLITGIKQKNYDLGFEEIKDQLFLNGKKNVSLITGSTGRKDETDILFNFNKNHTYWKKISSYFSWEQKFSSIKKASCYPLSIKEFSAIERFYDLCEFNILDFIDLPSSITKNNEITINNKIIKKKWKKEQLSKEIDTLLLGYPNELAFEINTKFYQDLLEFFAKLDVAVFALDKGGASDYNMIHSKFHNHKPRIYIPTIEKEDLPYFTYLKNLGKINTPVLGVAGISAQSGKFTTQLIIKKILSNAGYKIGWLSSEPQGEMFGADISFPYGFKSNIDFRIELWPKLLSSIIKGIELFKEPDIIISGHQSGLIPFSKNLSLDSNYENFRSLIYFGGICPDAVIMNVSINDDIDLIERNIFSLKYVYGINVILIVLSTRFRENVNLGGQLPLIKQGHVDANIWKNKADLLYNRTKLQVVNVLNEQDNDIILNTIVNYF